MLWIVVPAKAPALAKTRLSGMLTRQQRAKLARDLFRRTLSVAGAAVPNAQLACVSNSAELHGLAAAAGALSICDSGCGLNEALGLADSKIPQDDAMLVLPADLPLLSLEDVKALVDSPSPFVIAPNRLRDGTNALLYRRGPRVFRFGHGSFLSHLGGILGGGAAWDIIDRPGLSFDLDLPEDLRELAVGRTAGELEDACSSGQLIAQHARCPVECEALR